MGMHKEKGNTANRYTDEQKRKVVDFVNSQGRGGIAAAQKKFGVSYIAIASWQKRMGLNGKAVKAAKTGGAHPAIKASNIQREIQREVERQIKPHVQHLILLKTRIKELVKAL